MTLVVAVSTAIPFVYIYSTCTQKYYGSWQSHCSELEHPAVREYHPLIQMCSLNRSATGGRPPTTCSDGYSPRATFTPFALPCAAPFNWTLKSLQMFSPNTEMEIKSAYESINRTTLFPFIKQLPCGFGEATLSLSIGGRRRFDECPWGVTDISI